MFFACFKKSIFDEKIFFCPWWTQAINLGNISQKNSQVPGLATLLPYMKKIFFADLDDLGHGKTRPKVYRCDREMCAMASQVNKCKIMSRNVYCSLLNTTQQITSR